VYGDEFKEMARQRALKMIEEGTHNMLGGEIQRSRVKAGTHNFLGGKIQREMNLRRSADGTHPNKIQVTCPFCNKTGGKSNMKRYHFDKCKNSPTYFPNLIKCPHCDVTGVNQYNMYRWHFDNCKYKIIDF